MIRLESIKAINLKNLIYMKICPLKLKTFTGPFLSLL